MASLEIHHEKLASRNQQLEEKVKYFRKKVYATSNGKNIREENAGERVDTMKALNAKKTISLSPGK